MQPIRKILVALDHSSLDSELVDYANFFVNITEVTTVHFMHVIKVALSSKMKKEFPGLEQDILDQRKREIEAVISEHFSPNRKVEHFFNISNEENRIKPFVKAIKDEAIDMIMVGNKDLHKGIAGTFTHRIARRSPCHILSVPVGGSSHLKITHGIKKILVPLDFSDHSKQALERAILIGSRIKKPVEILCQNVYTVPSGYHYSGKSREEFAELMKNHAIEHYNEFIKTIDTKGIKITPIFSNDINEDKTSDIRDLARKENVDGIIIGSRGKTTAALLLGSVAEKLVSNEHMFPVLVVRRKDDYENFISRLRKL